MKLSNLIISSHISTQVMYEEDCPLWLNDTAKHYILAAS